MSATPVVGGVRAVIALGANLGDRAATLDAALAEVAAFPFTTDVRASSVVETIAVTLDGEDAAAPRYLNAIALAQTRLAPTLLLRALHAIEARHGRERRARWGDRTLDLDLIAYGQVQSTGADLTLPHPRAAEREFVLAPWFELDPDARIPGAGAVGDLLARVREGS